MQLFYEDCGTGQRREQGEALQPSIINVSSLIQFYLRGLGATTFTQRNKEKTTLIDKGVRLDLLDLYGVGLGGTKESQETVAGYLHPRGASMGESRRPVPTADSVAAVELGPCQGEVIRAPAGNALRGTNGSFMLS